MVISHRHQAAEQQRRAEYAAAGRQSVVTLMSLDFNKAKADVQRIIDNSTGQFRDDFKNQADDFVKVAQDSKVITEVTVNSTGVESMTNDSAVVLVSATSRVTNAAGAKQEPRTWRLSVSLFRSLQLDLRGSAANVAEVVGCQFHRRRSDVLFEAI